MKITVLVENQSNHAELLPEHGLSLYLEHRGKFYLLDAGETERFSLNAARLNCDLSAISAAALSHGHYDHANGFAALLEQNQSVCVYARPAVMEPQYHGARYIGLSSLLREQYTHRFNLSDTQRELAPGLWLVPDAVAHEQSLVAETEQGLVAMNSCCHAGADHIVADILERFPGQKVHALVGGLHLMGPGGVETLGPEPDEVRTLIHRLVEDLGVEYIYTGHCTGSPAYHLLLETCPAQVRAIQTGDSLVF